MLLRAGKNAVCRVMQQRYLPCMQLQPMLLALAGCKRQNVAREREHVFEKEAIFRSREQQRKSRLLLLLLLQSDQAIYGELDEPSHFLLLLSSYSARRRSDPFPWQHLDFREWNKLDRVVVSFGWCCFTFPSPSSFSSLPLLSIPMAAAACVIHGKS
jgi:hypothetical protein